MKTTNQAIFAALYTLDFVLNHFNSSLHLSLFSKLIQTSMQFSDCSNSEFIENLSKSWAGIFLGKVVMRSAVDFGGLQVLSSTNFLQF